MKAFVTGGTGFVGQRLIRQLCAKGYTVHGLARSPRSRHLIEKLGAVAFAGDITNRESMRKGMQGCDVVFHLAAWYKVGDPDWTRAELVNVGGTRKVLSLAYELKIPKIVYTSTVGVFSDTHGEMADEESYTEGPFLSEYERTKWLAHYTVAVPFIRRGAPIVIVMPGGIYGPGDTSIIGELMTRFYKGQPPFPALPGPTTTLTYAHVEDVATGHILAAEKGVPGESYILAGPAVPLGDMVDFWARLTGKRRPLFHIPSRLLKPFAPLMKLVGGVVDLPSSFSGEALLSLGSTYTATSAKAEAELGWEQRPLQAGMLETFEHIAAKTAAEPPKQSREREIATLALLSAAVLFVLWLLKRRNEQ